MSDKLLPLLCCPVCESELRRAPGEKSVVCASGHTFDVARAGYINLLPPGKGKNARTGDESRMVRARSAFLSLGYYDAISSSLAACLQPYLPEHPVICDMGCGEGTHTANLAGALPGAYVLGFDASKEAAEIGSKRAKRLGLLSPDGIGGEGSSLCCFPGNLFRLPLRPHCVDAAVSLFAPVAGDECRRILKPDGILAVVSSGRDHLIELRHLIYDEVRLNDTLPEAPEGFCLAERKSLSYTVTLASPEEIENLFVMTPFYYKTTEAGRARLLSRDRLDVTVSVDYSLFRAGTESGDHQEIGGTL